MNTCGASCLIMRTRSSLIQPGISHHWPLNLLPQRTQMLHNKKIRSIQLPNRQRYLLLLKLQSEKSRSLLRFRLQPSWPRMSSKVLHHRALTSRVNNNSSISKSRLTIIFWWRSSMQTSNSSSNSNMVKRTTTRSLNSEVCVKKKSFKS